MGCHSRDATEFPDTATATETSLCSLYPTIEHFDQFLQKHIFFGTQWFLSPQLIRHDNSNALIELNHMIFEQGV